MDVFRALPAIREELDDIDQRLRGRMARVVASDGHMVTVEIPTAGPDGSLVWDGPLGPYPSTVASLAAGSTGELLPLRGTQALFVAIGDAAVISHETALRHGGRQQTTSIGAFTNVFTREIPLLPGHWELNFLVTSAYRRSVATGGIVLRIANDAGASSAEAAMVYDANVAGTDLSYMPISLPWKTSLDVPAGGQTVTLTVEFRGDGTAGTTWLYGSTLTGHAVRTRAWG